MTGLTPAQTFPCPQCHAILFVGTTQCDQCSAAIDPVAAQAEAERHRMVLTANGEANSLVLSARTFLVFAGLSFLPFLGLIGRVGYAFLLVQVPVLALRWHRRYGDWTDPDAEMQEARGWWKQALLIWGAALLVLPILLFLQFGGR